MGSAMENFCCANKDEENNNQQNDSTNSSVSLPGNKKLPSYVLLKFFVL